MKNLFDFFEQYNFTIDENSPEEHEVGIDPEMLGHIFENLLEENREKGAFYTPKEIVHYMCQESLIQYFITNLSDTSIDDIELFVNGKKVPDTFTKKETASEIEKLLLKVKICDPAIGSGAFPMGLLKEIYECRRLIYPYLRTNKKFDPALVKKEIIQTAIHGVDIEKGAVDIARLRFWLALVVDEEEPQPLPNLDYKIMQGNSLLEQFEDVDMSKVASGTNLKIIEPERDLFGNIKEEQLAMTFVKTEIVERIQQQTKNYFDENDINIKAQIRNDINDCIHQHIEFNLELREKQLGRLINVSDEKVRTGLKTKKKFDSYKETLNNLRQTRKKLHEIQNSDERPYFLWHLFFKDEFETGGFDIVIGNPPYIQLQKMGKDADILEKSDFKTFARTGDIYCLFYEQGKNILKKNGVLSYITSNKWMRAGYGSTLRKYFVENCNPLKLIDFGGYQVLANATVDTNILILKNALYQNTTHTCILSRNLKRLILLSDYFRQNNQPSSFENGNSWVILSGIEQRIKSKIEAAGIKLKDWKINIYRGVLTGFNEAFIISQETRDRLVSASSKNADIIRPILRGRDIQKYKSLWSGLYIIGTFPSLKVKIDQYPAVKNHLLKFGKRRLEQSGLEGARKETNNQWYETQDSINYWDDFYKPKIIYPEITKFINFVLDRQEHFYVNNKCFILTGEYIEFLTAFLNSSLFKFCFLNNFPELMGGTRELRKIFLEQIPVIKITSDQNTQFKERVERIQKLKSANKETKALEKEIDIMIYDLYNLTDKEREAIGFIEIS